MTGNKRDDGDRSDGQQERRRQERWATGVKATTSATGGRAARSERSNVSWSDGDGAKATTGHRSDGGDRSDGCDRTGQTAATGDWSDGQKERQD